LQDISTSLLSLCSSRPLRLKGEQVNAGKAIRVFDETILMILYPGKHARVILVGFEKKRARQRQGVD
jgi:hypothetical protein